MPLIKLIIYMQIFITKAMSYCRLFLCLLLISIQPCSANTSFIEQFQIEPLINEETADRIIQYYSEDISLPLEQQKDELFMLETRLNTASTLHEEKAVYWFIRGLLQQNIASYYTLLKKPQFAKTHLNNKNKAYEKAMALAKKPNNNLSASIYSTMKHGLPQNLKIEATKNELALGGNGESESYYWYLHWSNIDQLKKAGRDKEAETAYKNMQRELKNSGQNTAIYKDLSKKIEKKTLEKIEKPEPQSGSKPEKTEKSKTPEKTGTSKNRPEYSKYTIIFSVAIFSILILIGLIIHELVQKKKNKNL